MRIAWNTYRRALRAGSWAVNTASRQVVAAVAENTGPALQPHGLAARMQGWQRAVPACRDSCRRRRARRSTADPTQRRRATEAARRQSQGADEGNRRPQVAPSCGHAATRRSRPAPLTRRHRLGCIISVAEPPNEHGRPRLRARRRRTPLPIRRQHPCPSVVCGFGWSGLSGVIFKRVRVLAGLAAGGRVTDDQSCHAAKTAGLDCGASRFVACAHSLAPIRLPPRSSVTSALQSSTLEQVAGKREEPASSPARSSCVAGLFLVQVVPDQRRMPRYFVHDRRDKIAQRRASQRRWGRPGDPAARLRSRLPQTRPPAMPGPNLAPLPRAHGQPRPKFESDLWEAADNPAPTPN